MKFIFPATVPIPGKLNVVKVNVDKSGGEKRCSYKLSSYKSTALLLMALLSHGVAVYAELPVPCSGGSCGGATWLGAGAATQSIHGLGDVGQELRIQQLSERALFNWDTFNIGRDDKVSFDQPGTSSLALNRIFQQSPSRLLGSIQANGQVYLINRAGIIFGKDSQINVGTLLASSLEVPDIDASGTVSDADYTGFLEGGLTSFFTQSTSGAVAHALANRETEYSSGEALPENFTELTGPDGQAFARGAIWAEQGAKLQTGEFGKVMLFGSEVTNAGVINTPRGQTIIAASKDKLWIEPSSELRGFVIELNHGGDVTNLGDIIASEGNVSLLGRVVRQDGLVRATTSVDFNGSILLRADEVASISKPSGVSSIQRVYDTYGEVVAGKGSVTEVALEESAATAVDAQPFAPSSIEVLGQNIRLEAGARIAAKSGVINIEARASLGEDPDAASIAVDSGVVIDVSGADTELEMSRNLIEVQLFSNELKDAPLQRNGSLRGETLVVDIRKGTPLADIAPALATIKKTLSEKAAAGGSISFTSAGSVSFADEVLINLSGGEIHYDEGFLNTSRLVTRTGEVLDVSEARPDLVYQGLYGDFTRDNFKWGVTQRWASNVGGFSVFEPAYSEFQPGGTLAVSGSVIAGLNELDIITEGRIGLYQRRQPPMRGMLQVGRESIISSQTSFGAPGVSILKSVTDAQRELLEQRDDVLITEDFIKRSGLSVIDVMSNGGIVIGNAGQAVELPSFSSLKARAKYISVAGGVVSASGSIELIVDTPASGFDLIPDTVLGLDLADQTIFDVAGRWDNNFIDPAINPAINDGRATYSALAVDGGSILLGSSVPGAIVNASGTQAFDVSAGGFVNESASLNIGNGGALTLNFGEEGLAINANADNANADNASADSVWTVKGFGGSKGAKFKLIAPQLQFDHEASAGLAVVDGEFIIGSTLFSQAGLGDIALTATQETLLLPAGDYALTRQRFIAQSQAFIEQPGGGRLSTVFDPILPALAERSAVALELGVAGVNPVDLVVATGARITTDGEGSITLRNQSEGEILVDGLISAPAGSIEILALSFSEKNYSALRNLIWLGPNARIDVSGTAIPTTDPTTLPTVKVLEGGTVAIAATGYVVSEAGSSIDVSGTAALVSVRGELPHGEQVAPGISRANIGSDAGEVKITATEGFVLGGDLLGAGGLDTSRGGLLQAAIKGDRALTDTSVVNFDNQRQLFLGDKRVVANEGFSVVDGDSPVGRSFAGIRDEDNGIASLSLGDIAKGGFTRVELAAKDNIVFDTSGDTETFTARFGERLFLDASRITANSDLLLQAPHIRLSGSGSNTGRAETALHRAQFSADLIDVLGSVNIDNVGSLLLSSSGDIRLGGTEGVFSGTGSLRSPGLIELQARQVYPLTLANFNVSASSSVGNEGEIRITGSGAAPTQTLTAGGALILKADSIFVDGMLKAPFGSLTLEASHIELASGGVLSVAADAPLVPFGDSFFDSLPESAGVELLADSVVMQADSLIDLSGGGELVDWLFVAGPGGSQDILNAQLRPNSYAIVPGVDTVPLVSNINFGGAHIDDGSTLTLTGVEGLADGDYTLLPARYALLEGAWLLNLETDYLDISPDTTAALLDGTPLVAGRFSIAHSNVKSSRYSALALRPGAEARSFSEYEDQFASLFQLDRSNVETRFWQPADAAQLQLTVVDELSLGGVIEGRAAADGRAGLMSISADTLAVVNTKNTTLADVELFADDLNRLDVGTLLIGGLATRTANGLAIEAEANGVEIADGVELALPEFLLTAKNKIDIGAAKLLGTQETAANLALSVSGNNAVVGLLSSKNVLVTRSSEALQAEAEISVADAAVLASEGTALLSARGDVSLSSASVLAPALYLEAKRIALGQGSPDDGGLRLLPANLARLSGSELLTLKSTELIDAYGNVTIDNPALALTIAGPGLNNVEGGDLSITAQQAIFDNSDQRVAGQMTQPQGVLSITAERVATGNNAMALQGWRQVEVAAGALQAGGEGELALNGAESADFILSVLTAKPGGDLTVSSNGVLRFLLADTPLAVNGIGLGGRFSAKAADLTFNTALLMPSGSVNLQATGNVTVGGDAVVDVAGISAEFLNINQDTWGGDVRLSSDSGDVTVVEGAIVDVSSGGPAQRSGAVEILAKQGEADIAGSLIANRGDSLGRNGGRIKIDALAFARGNSANPFAAINQYLNEQGFSAERVYRQRQGDLLISADTIINARKVAVAVDLGSLTVGGVIDASGGDENGGRIDLFSRDDMTLGMTARLLARSDLGDGGDVSVSTESGWLKIFDGATIAVDGATRGGEVELRASRTVAQDDVQIVVLDSSGADTVFNDEIQGADQVRLEGLRTYTEVDGSITSSDIDGYYADAKAFINTHRGAISDRLGLAAIDNAILTPGLVVERQGDLALNAPIDLLNWIFDADVSAGIDTLLPGYLALKATGDLNVNAALTSGTKETCSRGVCSIDSSAAPSWSLALSAGSDGGAWWETSTEGDLNVADTTLVMTSTGDISLAAGNELNLLGQVVSMGRGEGVEVPGGGRSPPVALTENGGDLQLQAGGSIRGDGNQVAVPFVTDGMTLYKSFTETDISGLIVKGPSSNVGGYSFDVGSLGGGDIDISSGGNIAALSVGATTALLLDKGVVTERVNDGNVDIKVAGDFNSSVLMVGDGDGYLQVGGGVGVDFNYGGSVSQPAYSRFALQGGSISVNAVQGVQAGGALNPTLPYFLSYGENSTFEVESLAGDITINARELSRDVPFNFPSTAADQYRALTIQYPGTVSLTAHHGDIAVDGQMRLSPSSKGWLGLLADGDIAVSGGGVQMSEVDPDSVPLRGATGAPDLTTQVDILAVLPESLLHGADDKPAAIISRTGDIGSGGSVFLLQLPMAANLFAGGDIVRPKLRLKHSGQNSVSSVTAGGEISAVDIKIEGPGRLDIAARDNIDFGLGVGVTSLGGLSDTRLAGIGGADVNLYVGALPDELNWTGFIKPYLDNGELRDTLLGDMKIFLASLSKEAITDRDTLLAFLATPDADRSSFSSEAFKSPAELDALLTGLAIDLELSSALAGSNVSDILRDTFLNDPVLNEGLVDSIRVFRSRSVEDLDSEIALQLFDVLSNAEQRLIVERAMLSLPEKQQREITLSVFEATPALLQRDLIQQAFFGQLRDAGRLANQAGPQAFDIGYEAIEALFPETKYSGNLNLASNYTGDLVLNTNRIYTLDGGDINILIPGGSANAGSPFEGDDASRVGVVVQKEGDVRAMVHDSFAVNQSRVFTLGGGDILMWASQGNLDAGRGAKTAISSPPPKVTFGANGELIIDFGAAIAGSGIRQIATGQVTSSFVVDPNNLKPVNGVDLVAPNGEVNAGDAGIGAAGNLNIAAARVIGAEQIEVGGVSVGIPDDNSGAAASLVGVSNVAGDATGGVADAAASQLQDEASNRLAFLEVNVLDYGERKYSPSLR